MTDPHGQQPPDGPSQPSPGGGQPPQPGEQPTPQGYPYPYPPVPAPPSYPAPGYPAPTYPTPGYPASAPPGYHVPPGYPAPPGYPVPPGYPASAVYSAPPGYPVPGATGKPVWWRNPPLVIGVALAAVALVVAAVVLLGGRRSPSETVEAFLDAFFRQDLAEVLDLSCGEMYADAMRELQRRERASAPPTSFLDPGMQVRWTVGSEVESGSTATVLFRLTLIRNGQVEDEDSLTAYLQKQDGDWKVCEID